MCHTKIQNQSMVLRRNKSRFIVRHKSNKGCCIERCYSKNSRRIIRYHNSKGRRIDWYRSIKDSITMTPRTCTILNSHSPRQSDNENVKRSDSVKKNKRQRDVIKKLKVLDMTLTAAGYSTPLTRLCEQRQPLDRASSDNIDNYYYDNNFN